MAFTSSATVMPQNEAYEHHNLWMKTVKKVSYSCYRGSSRFDSVRSSVYRDAALMGFYWVLCSLFYCSAPQTWQTVTHRLMRDRHRRHILNRVRHHRNDDRQRCKDEKNDVREHCELPGRNTEESLSLVNDEQRPTA